MKKAVRSLSPATVIASIALFVSLGGVSYGVAAGSIDSREIENNAIRTEDVRNNGLSGRDLASGSVQSRDLRDGAVRGLDVNDRSLGGADIADNSLGDREINEPALDVQRLAGVDASRYVKNVRRVRSETASDPATPKTAPPVNCPKGKRLLGGGAAGERGRRHPRGPERQRAERERLDRLGLRHGADGQLAARCGGDLRLSDLGARSRSPTSG